MIRAEVSMYPVGTGSADTGFYAEKAAEAAREVEDVRCEASPAGAVLEAGSFKTVGEAAERMLEAVHNLGVGRIGAVIVIDSEPARRAARTPGAP